MSQPPAADDQPDVDETGPDATKTESRPRRHLTAGALIGVLTALLGFAIAVQLHSNSSSDGLAGLREDELVNILDNQNALADRQRERIAADESSLQQLQASGNRNSVAEQQARQELDDLGILLGTVPATGPGVIVTITDPAHKLKAEDLLDVVQELRGAGAEALQFGPVRIGASSSFTDTAEGVAVDGRAEVAPYTVLAIGSATTLDTALNIPGGVAATARAAGGDATVNEQAKVDITALRSLSAPKYAKPTGK
jgi:uncharacterized protein YlxW (UPF0749 family)